MSTTVVGLFDTRESAQGAVQDLIDAGFDRAKISIVAADPQGTMYKETTDGMTENLAGEGARTGLTSGAVVGGLLGLLIGTGLIFVPAGFAVAGPIAGLIAGGAAGAATGGIIGGLIGMGIPSDQADYYAEGIRRGGTLVALQAIDDRIEEAHTILDRDGAINIEDRAAGYRVGGFNQFDPEAPVFTTAEAERERDRWREVMPAAPAPNIRAFVDGNLPQSSLADHYAYADNGPTDESNEAPYGAPGIETGGHAVDGTPDTRGIVEKVSDKLTGDHIDDKTGKRVD